MENSKRLSLLRPLRMACGQFLACCAVVFIRALYVHRAKLWNDPHLVNFAAAWIPGIVSVIIGILPEKDWAKMRVHHRVLIIVVGMTWSALLWHQQIVNDKSTSESQNKAVNDAVNKANAHSDQKIAEVGRDVLNVGSSLSETASSLSGDIQKTAEAIQQTSDRLDASIGKVGKPVPPAPAELRLTLWDTKATADKPTLVETLNSDQDGNFLVAFTFVNSSEATAENIDVWIQVCDVCSFATEPNGFEHPEGGDDHTRHRQINSLNPGASIEKTTVLIKAPPSIRRFQLAFRYSCKTCGGKSTPRQVATILRGN